MDKLLSNKNLDLNNLIKMMNDDDSLNEEAMLMEQASSKISKEEAHEQTSKVYNDQLNNVIPSTFAESTYLLDGRPFRLKKRDYLEMIYNAKVDDGLLMCGRQVEKSTTFSVLMANNTLLVPFFRGLYFAPLNEQVKMFSEDRLGRLFTYSQEDVIKNTFMTSADKQNVFNKSFSNGALLYLRHCYGLGDNIRGLSVNGAFGDEIQDIDIDALPVIRETQAHALDLGPCFRMTWYSGTPKTYSNTIQQLWESSTQCEWVVRCPHCSADQIMGAKNITPTQYLCRKCRMEITHQDVAKRGRWIKLNDNDSAFTWGFRITQMMSPAMPASEVWKKFETYDKQRLYNEVLGRSYENADKPFPPTLLNMMAANDTKMLGRREGIFNNRPLFLGADWGTGGKSFTIVVVGGYNESGRFEVVYTHKYAKGDEVERDFQVKHIAGLMNIFQIAYAIADYGHGFQSNQQLKNMFGDRFDAMYYSHNLGKEKIYNKEKSMWVVNRTKTIYNYIKDCKDAQVVWPGGSRDEIQYMFDDHLAVQAEYKSMRPKAGQNKMITRSEEMYYTHPASQPDDAVHASVYAWSASKFKPNGVGNTTLFTGAMSR